MPRFLLILLCLFAGSGCSALIYEIVWLQLLQLVIGSSGVSLAVLLGTFMGGMCLGSLLLPRWIKARHHPLRVYALLELGTGLFGMLTLFGLPYLQQLYLTGMGHGMAGILWRGAICAVCLLPPTMFMGATLPAMSRWMEAKPDAASWWGVFYGGNIAGGVLGCVLAGFYLLRVYDMATASFVAVGINVLVAAIAWLIGGSAPYSGGASHMESERAPGYASVYVAIGISGLCALGAEVVWTRLLSLMLGPTVYTFSIILGVFLAGLGVGSGAGSYLSHRVKEPRAWLAGCQILLALTIAWAAFQLADSLPYWPGNLMSHGSPWAGFQNDILRCATGILPAAILWGASFPLALACIARKEQDPGRLVGEVYAANTVGAIVGAIGFSILGIPMLGSQDSQRLLISLSAIAACACNWEEEDRLGGGGSNPAGVVGPTNSLEVDWLRTPLAYNHRPLGSGLCGGRHEFLHCLFQMGRRAPLFPCKWKGGSLGRAARHASAAYAGPLTRPVTCKSAKYSGGGLWSGCNCRDVCCASRSAEHYYL